MSDPSHVHGYTKDKDALDPTHLPLDPVQALDQDILVLGVAPGMFRLGGAHHAPFSRALEKRRSRRLLVTTKRLEAAIAAAAMIGFRSPATASGTAATL